MYGAVIFDDETKPLAGWASVHGRQAFRVQSLGDLASDVYWWTNCTAPTYASHPGMRQSRFKRDDYLRPSMRQMHAELGLQPMRMQPARIAEITAEIFDRVMRLASVHHGVNRPVELRLQEDLYPMIIKPDESISRELDAALEQAHQPWFECLTAKPADSTIMSFRRPRMEHVLDVLTTPVPGTRWEFVEESRLPPERQRIDWLVTQSRPVLARAAVKRVNHDVAPVVVFGAGSKKERGWMSHPELLMLSKFAQIKVEGVFLGQEYEEQTVYKPVFTGGTMGSLSVSAGILADNYLMALAEPRTVKRIGQNNTKLYSPRAVWYNASAALYSLMPALMLHGSGFSVIGYGRGVVTVAVPRGALADVRKCAAAAGLQASLTVNADVAVQTALAS